MTIYIVIITCIISFWAFKSPEVLSRLICNPYAVKHQREWYRLLTSGLIHADWAHLIVNMFVLYSFGGVVEDYYNALFEDKGTWYFLSLYIGGIVASIIPTYGKHKDNPSYNSLGASGAVAAVMFANILFDPSQKICLYGLLCLPGIVMGIAYLVYSWYSSRKAADHVNHDAHFWGALYGFAFTLVLQPSLGPHFVHEIFTIFGSR